MLQVRDVQTGKVANFKNLVDLCNTYEEFKCKWNSGSKSPDELETEVNGGEIIRTIITESWDLDVGVGSPERFIVTHISEDVDPNHTPELDESYLLLRLSEEDITQVLYFYGLHDLEVSIEGDPTVTFVDGFELSDLTGGCHVKITGWLSYTKGYHEKQEEILRVAISESIQDVAHAKKGRVNHFAFL